MKKQLILALFTIFTMSQLAYGMDSKKIIFKKNTKEHSPKDWSAYRKTEDSFEAYDGNKPIGHINYGDSTNVNRNCYIISLFVDQAYRNNNIGSELLDLATKELYESGCRSISLIYMDWQSKRFYEKHNFDCDNSHRCQKTFLFPRDKKK